MSARAWLTAFLLGVREGFKGYVRGGSGMSYHYADGTPDFGLSDAYNRGANWGERARYGRSFGGASW